MGKKQSAIPVTPATPRPWWARRADPPRMELTFDITPWWAYADVASEFFDPAFSMVAQLFASTMRKHGIVAHRLALSPRQFTVTVPLEEPSRVEPMREAMYELHCLVDGLMRPCGLCSGTGFEPERGALHTCPTCRGTGIRRRVTCIAD